MLGEVGSADRVAIVLPTGPIELSKPALNLIRAKVTARAMAVPVPTGFPSDQGVAIDAYLRLVQAQRYAEALGVAEHRVSTAQSLPDRVTARLHLAAAKRALGDVEGAVFAYEEGIALARPAADGDEDVRLSLAVLSDNLALLRGVQGRYAEAMAASATALEMFERSLGPRNLQYAQALNTRSVLLFEAGKRDEAIAASNRALALVREIFKNDPARLAPFITDNQIITGGPAR
jgi:tetratricopeptide (TPR) repeat protein